MNTRPPSSPPPDSSTSPRQPTSPLGRGGLPIGQTRPGLGGRRGPARRPSRGGGGGGALSKFGADGGDRHSEGSAIDGSGARRGGGGPAGRAEGGEGAAGRAPPPPPPSEPRGRHWLRRSKFSARGRGGSECAGRERGGRGRGRGASGREGGREGGGGGARPAAFRRRHLFVVLKPLPLSSAQLSHNGQLFLAEGPEGGSVAPHREELLAGPKLHLMPTTKVGAELGSPGGRLSFVPRERASGSKNKSDAGEVEGRGGPEGRCFK